MKKYFSILWLLITPMGSIYAQSNSLLDIFDNSNYFNIFLNVILFSSLLLNALFLYKEFFPKSKINNNRKDKYEPYYKNQVDILNKNIETLEQKNESLNKRLAKFNPQINQGSKPINNPVNKQQHLSKREVKSKHPENEKPVTYDLDLKNSFKTFYLPSPFDEKRFSNEDASESPTSTSLYVINYDTINNKGDINIIEDANFDRAINSPHDYFEKVCIYDNPPDVNATRVKTTLAGEVELNGDDWLVTKKIRIKFI